MVRLGDSTPSTQEEEEIEPPDPVGPAHPAGHETSFPVSSFYALERTIPNYLNTNQLFRTRVGIEYAHGGNKKLENKKTWNYRVQNGVHTLYSNSESESLHVSN